MKKTTISIALICILILGFTHLIADTQLEFKEKSHDFGTIKEADGPVNFEFSFTNIGKSDIEIHSVKST